MTCHHDRFSSPPSRKSIRYMGFLEKPPVPGGGPNRAENRSETRRADGGPGDRKPKRSLYCTHPGSAGAPKQPDLRGIKRRAGSSCAVGRTALPTPSSGGTPLIRISRWGNGISMFSSLNRCSSRREMADRTPSVPSSGSGIQNPTSRSMPSAPNPVMKAAGAGSARTRGWACAACTRTSRARSTSDAYATATFTTTRTLRSV